MLKALAALVAIAFVGWGLCLVLAPDGQNSAINLAVAITLTPAALSLAMAGAVAVRWPLVGVTAILAGNGLRMGFAVVMVVALGRQAERWETTQDALAAWTVAFYLYLLAVETALLAVVLRTRVPCDSAER